MKKNPLVIILIIIILLGGAWTLWYLMQNQTQPASNDQEATSSDSSSSAPSTSTQTPSDATQQTASGQVAIKGNAFVPAKLTIKKGTTVTWTNEDTIKHNVVASDASHSGGLPTTNPLLSKGESYSFTFTEAGNFNYLCAPHASFMKGVVEVTE